MDQQATLNPEVPQKTADYCTLPDGTTVWVQTLNSLLKQDCARRANQFAAEECASYMPGGKLRSILAGQVKALSPEEQATILAGEAYRTRALDVVLDAEFPPIPEPEKGDMTDDAYMVVFGEWQTKCDERETARATREDELFECEREKALKMSAKARAEACVQAQVSRQYAEAYMRFYVVEELVRAVRHADDHSRRVYASTDAVEDLDDATLAVLREKYWEVESVKPEAVPTSPAG